MVLRRGHDLARWSASLAEGARKAFFCMAGVLAGALSIVPVQAAAGGGAVPALALDPSWNWMLNLIVVVAALLWVLLLRQRIHKQTELIRSEIGQKTAMAERYQQLFENANDIVYTHDLTGKLTSLNKAGERITGYAQSEMLAGDFSALVAPGQQNDFRRWLQDNLEGKSSPIHEWDILAKEGRRVTLEMNMRLLHQNGRPTEFEGIARDITERKREEANRLALERKLQDTQKMESLGLMAGGVAHDFNNLLTAILGNSNLASLEVAENSTARNYLNNIEKASLRAAELCKQMLAFSGRGRFQMQQLNLNALVQDLKNVLQISLYQKTSLELDLAVHLPAVDADPGQMRQLIINLVLNAAEAIGENPGVIRIKTGTASVDQAIQTEAHLFPELRMGAFVFVEITDTGAGMNDETQAKIFDPFFSTKFTGRGLGLPAVLGIVRGHNGAVRVKSQPGKGSTFTILIPALPIPALAIPEKKSASPSWIGSGTILVVEDEEVVSTVASRLLESYGFKVLQAMDGLAGVEVFKAHADQIDAVVLDLIMPRMNGEEAFDAIKRLRPETRVLLMSGFSEQDATDRFAGKGLAGFIQKPFKSDELREKVRHLFEPEKTENAEKAKNLAGKAG